MHWYLHVCFLCLQNSFQLAAKDHEVFWNEGNCIDLLNKEINLFMKLSEMLSDFEFTITIYNRQSKHPPTVKVNEWISDAWWERKNMNEGRACQQIHWGMNTWQTRETGGKKCKDKKEDTLGFSLGSEGKDIKRLKRWSSNWTKQRPNNYITL